LLAELEPVVERLLLRHLDTTREWFPHELIPYDRGRPFTPGEEWTVADADLAGSEITDAVRSSLLVNLLTEDNLPYYFRSIETIFGADGAWGTWARRWTAEEGRHSMVIYGYLMVTRAIDPVALERSRMCQVSSGISPDPASPLHAFIYLTMQELATRIAHRNTGNLLGDTAGYDVMMRVASDENRHHLFYRDLSSAAFELAPDEMMVAVADEAARFEMPGTGIPDFSRHASAIAKAGIYDLPIHHEQVLMPMVQRWNVSGMAGLGAVGEQARERLLGFVEKSGRVAQRLADRRAAALA
jgi:acyl-[acyl-carrier-protein] desaturase